MRKFVGVVAFGAAAWSATIYALAANSSDEQVARRAGKSVNELSDTDLDRDPVLNAYVGVVLAPAWLMLAVLGAVDTAINFLSRLQSEFDAGCSA
jgi:hypothetical protein